MKLDEKKRSELISKSINADKTKSYGTTRYVRKDHVQVFNTVKAFNRIDMNSLFKANLLSFKVPIHGETSNYEVEVLFDGILDAIKQEIKANQNKVEYKCIYRAIIKAINNQDIYIGCTCPDYCLKGDTEIKLLNGEVHTIDELKTMFEKGVDMWCYSVDDKGDFKPGHISDVWISGYANDMVKITLDNGKEIITTPNHRYMTRAGEYVQAKDLTIDQSLMPLYFSYTENGYENVKLNSRDTTSFVSVYKTVANEELKQQINKAKTRSGEDSIAIHHSDFNKLNNYPSNLIPMGRDEHYKWHYEHSNTDGRWDRAMDSAHAYWRTEEGRAKKSREMSELMTDYWVNITDEELEYRKQFYGDNWKLAIGEANHNVWENYTDEEYEARCKIISEVQNRPEIKEANSNRLKNTWANNYDLMCKKIGENTKKAAARGCFKTEAHHNAVVNNAKNNLHSESAKKNQKLSKFRRNLLELIDKGLDLTEDNFIKNRRPGDPKWSNMFGSFDEMLTYFKLNTYNHKVVNIEDIHYDEAIPVYDMTVDKYNNFFVNDGVMLHNCFRFQYWGTKERYNSMKTQLVPAKFTNPNNSKGAGCKHIMNVLANLDWALKLASTINNYIIYMQENEEDKFARIMFPAIYDMSYDKAVQMGLFGEEESDDLANTMDNEEDVEVIDQANAEEEDEIPVDDIEEPEEEVIEEPEEEEIA